jgi:hypothetical protein
VTNTQLYLAIGVPILVNIAFNGALILLLQMSINKRIDDLRDSLIALWRSELHRVEEVIDARLKALEERR